MLKVMAIVAAKAEALQWHILRRYWQSAVSGGHIFRPDKASGPGTADKGNCNVDPVHDERLAEVSAQDLIVVRRPE